MDTYELNLGLKKFKQMADDKMEKSLNSIIDDERREIVNDITSIINGHINVFDDQVIENIIDNSLMPYLKNASKQIANKNSQKLDSITSSVSRMSATKKGSSLESSFTMLINEFKRNQEFRILEKVVVEFADYVAKTIYSLDYPGVSHQNLDSIIHDISQSLKRYLMKTIVKVQDLYSESLASILKTYREQVLESINNYQQQLNSVTLEELEQYKDAISLTGKDIEEIDGILYFVDKNTRVKNQIVKSATGDIRTPNNDLLISVDRAKTLIIDNENTIIMSTAGIALGTPTDLYAMEIRFNSGSYEFYANSNIQTDSYKISKILTALGQNFPIINSKLMKDPNFRQICENVQKQVNQNAIFIDTPKQENTVGVRTEAPNNAAAFKTDSYSTQNGEPQQQEEQHTDISLDDRIFALEQNPIVQEYLALVEQRQNELEGNIVEGITL